jgi:hypothetical protein
VEGKSKIMKAASRVVCVENYEELFDVVLEKVFIANKKIRKKPLRDDVEKGESLHLSQLI